MSEAALVSRSDTGNIIYYGLIEPVRISIYGGADKGAYLVGSYLFSRVNDKPRSDAIDRRRKDGTEIPVISLPLSLGHVWVTVLNSVLLSRVF